MRPIEQILDLARWAPSGDNVQCWRFQILGEDRLLVHGFDTRDHCVYDLDGHASQLSIGALLETMRIAASTFRWTMRVERQLDTPEAQPVFAVTFAPDAKIQPSDLVAAIRVRCVQRRAMQRRAIRPDEKKLIEGSLPDGYTLLWLEGSRRLELARLLFANAWIRLTTPEAFEVHRRVIEWHARESEDRIPDQAVGLDPLTTRLMAWAMADWRRVRFMNTYLAGTVAPRIQLDFIPALACGAHMLILASREPKTIDDFVAAGAAVQRFWLAATQLGLQHQPEMTPLIFSRYVREDLRFSADDRALRAAVKLARRLESALGADIRRAVWLGRIGAGPRPSARSVRLPLDRLMVDGDTAS
jgi:nitroreductase